MRRTTISVSDPFKTNNFFVVSFCLIVFGFDGSGYFVFETPYTTSGKAHGSVEDQHMRKTILETEVSFPAIKRRLRVSSRKEVSLCSFVSIRSSPTFFADLLYVVLA